MSGIGRHRRQKDNDFDAPLFLFLALAFHFKLQPRWMSGNHLISKLQKTQLQSGGERV